jgi:Protein of unknown function (DUF3619)
MAALDHRHQSLGNRLEDRLENRLENRLEDRFASSVVLRLNEGTDALPHDITERLRFARERALALAQHRRRVQVAVAAGGAVAMGNGQAALSGPPSWGLRLASLLPLLVLVLGLLLIEQHSLNQQIQAAADIDTALLSDELPPAAYRDPGFREFLRTQEGP